MTVEASELSGETKTVLVNLARNLEPHVDEISSRWAKSYFESHPEATAASVAQMTQRASEELSRFVLYIKRGGFEEYFHTTEVIGKSLAKAGVPYAEVMSYIHLYEGSSLPALMSLYPEPRRLQKTFLALDLLYHKNISVLASAYFAVKEEALLQREQELILRNKELSTLQSVTDAALSSLALDPLLQDLLRRVVHGLDADGGTILLLDETSLELSAKAAVGLDREIAATYRVKAGEGLAGRIAVEQRAISVDADEDGLLDPFLKATGVKSVLGVPLRGHRRILGVVHVGRLTNRGFTDHEVSLLHIVAARTAVAIENARLYEQEKDRANVLEELNRLKSNFVAKVTHVLRTPLTTTSGNLQTLLRHWAKMSDEEKRAHVTKSYEASKRLTRLVDDMLFVMRLQDGRFHVKLAAVAPRPLVEEAIHEMGARYRDRAVEMDIPSDLPEVWADSERLLQVFVNLLDNAAKFSAASAPVHIKMRAVDREVVTEITDEGIGISPEELPKLFTAFGQGDSRAVTRSGPGIGLFLAKQLVEAMGGRIWVESQPERGSVFFFSLLTAAGVASPKPPRSCSYEPPSSAISSFGAEATDQTWSSV